MPYKPTFILKLLEKDEEKPRLDIQALTEKSKKFKFEVQALKDKKCTQKDISIICGISEGQFSKLINLNLKTDIPPSGKKRKSRISTLTAAHDKVLPKIQTHRDTIKVDSVSPYLKVFEYWYFWLIPTIIGGLFYLLHCLNFISYSIDKTHASFTAVIGFALNVLVAGIIFQRYYSKRPIISDNTKNDETRAVYLFTRYWLLILISWGVLYTIRFLWYKNLLNGSVIAEYTKIHSDNLDESGVTLTVITNVINAYNTIFMFFCFLILSKTKPLRKSYPTYKRNIRNFIGITSLVMIGALFDAIYIIPELDGIFTTLYSSYMAVGFILFVTMLLRPKFEGNRNTFYVGAVLFYATCMPVFSAAKDSVASIIVILIFAAGKILFGFMITDKIDKENNYLEKYMRAVYKPSGEKKSKL